MDSMASASLSPVFVLVGPLANSKQLSLWAHSEFRKSSSVGFIGVDSGTDVLVASGLPVTLSMGDMDSISNLKILRGSEKVPSIQLSREKERSDLGFALEFCHAQRASIVYAFGFQGGRFDHDFAVHLDLSAASARIPHVVSIGERGAVFYVSGKFAPLRLERKSVDALRRAGAPISRRKVKASQFVSVFPMGVPVTGLKLRGLRFPVMNGILSASSQGLSNEIRAREIEFRFRRGRLAIFFPA